MTDDKTIKTEKIPERDINAEDTIVLTAEEYSKLPETMREDIESMSRETEAETGKTGLPEEVPAFEVEEPGAAAEDSGIADEEPDGADLEDTLVMPAGYDAALDKAVKGDYSDDVERIFEESKEENRRANMTPEEVVDENIKKRKSTRKPRRKGPGIFTKLAIALVFVLVCFGLSFTSIFTVDSIEVEGNSYFTDEEIINMSHAVTGKNIFYDAGKGQIKKYLTKNPYIQKVSVRRRLPSTLVIKVKERKQMAAIVYGDEYLVIDNEGRLLRRTDTMPKVTIVTGIKIKTMDIDSVIEAENQEDFENALDMLNAADDGDIYFTRIEMKKDKMDGTMKVFIYDKLVCIGEYGEIMDAIEKDRLHKILEELFARGVKRGTITISKDGYASFVPAVE
jgi:cell division protein FtsQ